MRPSPKLLALVVVSLLVAAPATGDAGPRLSTRVKRAVQALHYRLPALLRGRPKDVDRLFARGLVKDPSTRTGLGERSERAELIRTLEKRLPKAVRAALADATGAPRDSIAPPDLDEAPPQIRAGLAHSIRQLGALVDEVARSGDVALARLLAAEQSHAFHKAMSGETYADEVPEPDGFRTDRLVLLAPPPRSARAVVLRSRQPARVNLDEVVEAASDHGIAPEEIAILDLRFESQRDARWVASSRQRPVARTRVVQMPMLDHTVPTVEQVVEALRMMVDPRYKLVHVHCKGGRGRTGVIVAAMRIALDGWDVDRAIAEARQYTMWRPLQEHFVREFAARWNGGLIRLDPVGPAAREPG